MLIPDWFYAMVPPGWWPDRPRDFFVYTLNVIPLPAGATPFGSDAQRVNTTQEIVFSKVADTLVFGGTALVTTTNGLTVIGGAPLDAAKGRGSLKLIKLFDPARNVVYTTTRAFVSPGAAASDERGTRDAGFVALDNLLSTARAPAGRPAIWPIPIAVRKGAALTAQLVNLNLAAAHHMRISFWCAAVYGAAA